MYSLSGNTRGTARGLVWRARTWKRMPRNKFACVIWIVFGLEAPWQSKFYELRLSLGTSLPVDDHTSWAIVLEEKGIDYSNSPPSLQQAPWPGRRRVGSLGEVPEGTPKHVWTRLMDWYWFPWVVKYWHGPATWTWPRLGTWPWIVAINQ
jgi:hypothetical protein